MKPQSSFHLVFFSLVLLLICINLDTTFSASVSESSENENQKENGEEDEAKVEALEVDDQVHVEDPEPFPVSVSVPVPVQTEFLEAPSGQTPLGCGRAKGPRKTPVYARPSTHSQIVIRLAPRQLVAVFEAAFIGGAHWYKLGGGFVLANAISRLGPCPQ